jgi:hypothetical protein
MGWSFDDSKVQKYINKAMVENQGNPSKAHGWLYALRETSDPKGDDRELAAAEHYMYAREYVRMGKSPEALMKFFALGYDPR